MTVRRDIWKYKIVFDSAIRVYVYCTQTFVGKKDWDKLNWMGILACVKENVFRLQYPYAPNK